MKKHSRLWIAVLPLLAGTLAGSPAIAEDPLGQETPPPADPGPFVLFPSAEALGKPAPGPRPTAVLKADEPLPFDPLENPRGLAGSFLNKVEDSWGKLSSKMEVLDPGDAFARPLPGSKWQSEDTLQLPVTGPLFLFGNLDATCDRVQTQDLKVTGKTGVAMKWAGWQHLEVEVRGATALTCEDAVRQASMKQQSELLFELQCRYPLAGPVKLEYESSAAPALTVADRDRLKQDLHLAIPLGDKGKFSFGAKHSWESAPIARPWTDGMELYIGVDLKR